VIGYEADTVGSGGTPNYHGGYVNTTIKTAGKLGLAESVANVDVWNADLMRQKARIDLITQVRGAYFAALIARENVKVTEALVRFTDSVYQIQLDQLKGGLVSVYEPIQLRALAVQARTALAQARNRYDAAWRQLAATVGIPGLQVGELEGTPDVLIPAVDYDVALPYVLANHTDVLAARNSEVQARYNLRLQEVTRIPDLMFYMALQKDYTTGPVYRTTFNTQVGVPVPVFDKNQGNIMNAHGTLLKASQEASRVQNDLASRLADAIERYKNASNIVQMYRDHILPDQARAYRGVYERHQQQPDLVGFADVVTAQQTLLVSINTYISSLATRWQALTDIGSLLQIETLDGMQAMTQPSGDLEVDLPEPLPAVPGNRGNERP
jgi:cobalt-zinc-cadmium efflux system outer membrane protein